MADTFGYKAFDEVEGIEVAWNQVSIDCALESPENLGRIYAEIHILKALKHENIIKYHYSWVDDKNKTINMITELFTSGSLRQYRKKHKSVDLKAIKNWGRQILQGLCYLHSHSLPVIHRDLKCDNIFVNGNNGEVKIGDLGLATVMQQPVARSVIGTPEFMAPELYDEEYNELVDVYSFGMCMLELLTCEYPYSECKNSAQIFKKISSGVKPEALSKVKDSQGKQFIEQCLLPAHLRKSAAELLNDPFLSIENSKEPPELHRYVPKSIDMPRPDPLSMEIDSDDILSGSTCSENSWETPDTSVSELRRSNGENEFKIQGRKNHEDSVSFNLRIASSCGKVKNIHFIFYLKVDTTFSIASEMVEELDLSNQDLTLIGELIDSVIIKLVPNWRPSSEKSNNAKSSYKGNGHVDDQNISSSRALASQVSGEAIFKQHGSRVANEEDNCSEGFQHGGCEGGLPESFIMNETMKNLDISFSGALSNDVGLLLESEANVDQLSELKLELEAIEMRFQQCFQELMKKKEEDKEKAKKRWIVRQIFVI
ncbi:serine/threonine-protein kinase WNK8-like isoform X2 [Diospyros lotus]|uniref:serine/threonine-protein kinase WNK8-like isoform X2 n=1 Tax=Diospyros lotus TaxID=55363 RepID=UPI00224D0AB8|nr:serine/threonine-protein kinase WNK8-like isoform X2 [Diospyros lotus]